MLKRYSQLFLAFKNQINLFKKQLRISIFYATIRHMLAELAWDRSTTAPSK